MGRYIFDGGPCIGKTTLTDMLVSASQGLYATIDEAARAIIEEEQTKELMVDGYRGVFPWTDIDRFQGRVASMQLRAEKSAPRRRHLLMDRNLPSSIAYLELAGARVPDWIYRAAKNVDADLVVIPDRLPYANDVQRKESDDVAGAIHQLVIDAYRELGHRIARVPAIGREERLDYVMRYIR
jgi:predicted ATPase